MASRNSSAPSSPSPSPSLLQSIQASPRKIDISQVKGNVSAQEKQRSWDVFSYFVSTKEGSYGAKVGQRIKLVEINVWGVPDNGEDSARATPEEADLRLRKSGLVAAESGGDAAYGQTVFEILVERDMCNVFGTLHGGCAAYIVDPCSVSSLIALGSRLGIDATGVSQSMNLQWHNPVKV
ncbi:hypothetical protein AX16_007909 [Volvariella volvacea WC 439]|nr:hypothetical protein AX16_007909 [Volvariella volvacea WC 439]